MPINTIRLYDIMYSYIHDINNIIVMSMSSVFADVYMSDIVAQVTVF